MGPGQDRIDDPGTAVRCATVVGHITDCAMRPGLYTTVQPVLSGHSKIDETKVLMANGSLMNVQSIAEWGHSAILLTCIKR